MIKELCLKEEAAAVCLIENTFFFSLRDDFSSSYSSFIDGVRFE